MKIHANAPFGPKGRLTMVRRVTEQGWSLTEVAEAAGVSERTARKWVGRYRSEGEAACSIAARPQRRSPTAPRSAAERRSRHFAGCG